MLLNFLLIIAESEPWFTDRKIQKINSSASQLKFRLPDFRLARVPSRPSPVSGGRGPFGRVAALQCAALFASLKRANFWSSFFSKRLCSRGQIFGQAFFQKGCAQEGEFLVKLFFKKVVLKRANFWSSFFSKRLCSRGQIFGQAFFQKGCAQEGKFLVKLFFRKVVLKRANFWSSFFSKRLCSRGLIYTY